LSSFGANTAAVQAPVFESDREKFFRILLHDDRSSFYILSTDATGEWSDSAFKADALANYEFNLVSNYYITHNGFTGKRRLSVRTRQLNSLFFDLDCHEASPSQCEPLVREILARVNRAVRTATLPMPTMVVDSGRGVHLYYVLDKSVPYRFRGAGEVNEPGISFFCHVQEQLADVLDEVLDGLDGVTVDRAVFDHTRVSRIPDTFNAKAGRRARLVGASEAYHSLSDLDTYKPAALPKRAAGLPKKTSGKPAVILKYDRLMMSRLNKVAELQAYRQYDCEGNRELMCFVYYNTAVQIYSQEDAWDRLLAFNALFKKPVPQSELGGIRSSVSQVANVKGEKGYYVLNASSLVRLLSLTEKEMLDTQFFASKRMVERMEAKRKTKEKRDARNERIVALYKSGTMTQQQVADAVGCTARTVHTVLKEAGMTRANAVPKTARRKGAVSLKDAARKFLDAGAHVFSAQECGRILRFSKSEIFWPTCLLSSDKGYLVGSILSSIFDGRGVFSLGSCGVVASPLLSFRLSAWCSAMLPFGFAFLFIPGCG